MLTERIDHYFDRIGRRLYLYIDLPLELIYMVIYILSGAYTENSLFPFAFAWMVIVYLSVKLVLDFNRLHDMGYKIWSALFFYVSIYVMAYFDIPVQYASMGWFVIMMTKTNEVKAAAYGEQVPTLTGFFNFNTGLGRLKFLYASFLAILGRTTLFILLLGLAHVNVRYKVQFTIFMLLVDGVFICCQCMLIRKRLLDCKIRVKAVLNLVILATLFILVAAEYRLSPDLPLKVLGLIILGLGIYKGPASETKNEI